METFYKKVILSTVLSTTIISVGSANETQSLDQINLAYSGDQSRIGLGINEEGEFIGDFLKSFKSTYRTNWMAEGWYSDGAGGLKLDYHWVAADSESDLINNAEQYKVNKLFFAVDQNTFDDRKITIGGGKESHDKFWNINLSKSITGTRLISNTSIFTNETINDFLGTHATTQLRTIEDITRIYERPYEWGIGARLGKYFSNNLVRLTGGLDYEQGDFSSDQLTASIDLEKYFSNTGHSLALHVEQIEKGGDFAFDKSDTRAFLMYRYDFGRTYQPTERFEEVKMVDEEALARLKEERRIVVQNEIDLSSMAFFNLDESKLRDDTMNVLSDLVGKIKAQKLGSKINIVGHTCSIGTDDYNQVLSEARAKAAHDFFIANGIESELILSSGKGESEPAFDNKSSDQPKNRRVAISFLTLESNFKEAEISADDVPVKWVKKPIKTAPSWLARALNNPAKHKRTVDVYQYVETESKTTLGDVVVLNQAPQAGDDGLTILRNSSAILIDVLNNDTDGEGDTLTVIDVMQPSNGTVVNNGTSLTYTPNNGFIGIDTFEYTIDDGQGDQATAQVTITVENNLPTAVNDAVLATGSQPLIIDVINNDTDSDGSILTVESVTQGQNGSVIINSDGTLTYQANMGFVGTDNFTYIIVDEDGGQSSASVTVTVESDNLAPIAIDDLYLVSLNGSLTFNPLTNDSDPDGDTISLESVDSTGLKGTLTVNSDGSLSYQAPFLFRGNDSFTYTITDGNGETATATVIMCVAD
jgi:outer membrane protein OmpA-like peptidoglycan-associated protein